MEWYWWVLIAVAAIFVLGSIMGRRAPDRRNELIAMTEGARRSAREAEQYSAAAIAFLRDLPVIHDAEPGQSQSHEQVAANLRGFFATRFVRTHVVAGGRRLALVQEINGRPDRTVTREIVRIGPDQWNVRTFSSPEFGSAIRAAEAKDLAESGAPSPTAR